MNITADQLAKIFGGSSATYAQWVDPLNTAFEAEQINTKQRVAMFLAQLGVESARFTATKENLNYGVDGLLKTFGKYFGSTSVAAQYARKPQAIASRVYANRMGNGDEASGEGWKYRGRGLIQLTGKENYTKCGQALGVDLVGQPELVETNLYAVLSAAWFWSSKGLNAYADKGDIVGCSKRVNGGTHGLAERQAFYTKGLAVL